jgi:hypothetical protein
MSDNLMPKFNELLSEAHSASEEVDLFDLDSKNPESREKWNLLVAAEAKAKQCLIEFIQQNPELVPRLLEHSKRSYLMQ